MQTVDLPGDATGPLGVDETDRPIWLTATPEGDASLDSLASSQQVVLGPLPHPRYLRFYWRAKTTAANGGLVALEMANMDDATFRLATIDVRAPMSVAPITPAEDHLIDAAVSSDGSAIVTARRGPNGSSVLEFLGAQTRRQHTVDGTIDLLDVWPAGQRVFFRAGSAAVMSWNVSTGAVSAITENDVYAYAVSSRGKIATSRFTQNGPALTVCVSDV